MGLGVSLFLNVGGDHVLQVGLDHTLNLAISQQLLSLLGLGQSLLDRVGEGLDVGIDLLGRMGLHSSSKSLG